MDINDVSPAVLSGQWHLVHEVKELKAMFYLTICTQYILEPVLHNWSNKEGSVLFHDVLNTFYLRLVIWCQTYGKGPFR